MDCKDCELLTEKVARLEERIEAIVQARGEMWLRLDERFRGSDKVRDDIAHALELRFVDRFTAETELRNKMEVAVNNRLEGMNEFRHQLDRQASSFVTWGNLLAVSAAISGIVVGVTEFFLRILK